MGEWRVEATYQGYPCSMVEWEQHDGLTPGRGRVHVDLVYCGIVVPGGQPQPGGAGGGPTVTPGSNTVPVDTSKKLVDARAIPWRGVNGFEWPGQLDITTWSKGFVGTVAGYGPQLPPVDGGFAQFGDLVLHTYDGGALISTITYRDVHVDTEGIEETLADLANCEDHNEGVLNVPLMDTAAYFRTHGSAFFRINCRHASGELDQTSLKADTTFPSVASVSDAGVSVMPVSWRRWTALEVFRFLFSQLPSTPIIVGSPDDPMASERTCDIVKDAVSLPAPEDVIGEGEPVVEVLERLLDRFGYLAKRQPDGNYVVSRKGATISDPNTISRGGGKYDKGTHKNYETRSVRRTGRPAAIFVQGKRRVLRGASSYINVLPDLDGGIMRAEDWLAKYGRTLWYYDRQALVGHEKQFIAVVRDMPTKRGTQLREILRTNCYRMYAPAFLFAGKPKGYSLANSDFEQSPYLPYVDAAYYLKELVALDKKVPRDANPQKGDLGKFIIRGEIVWAQRWAQYIFRGFAQLKAYWAAQHKTLTDDVAFYASAVAQKESQLADVGFHLDAINKQLSGVVLDVNQTIYSINVEADTAAALKELGFQPSTWKIFTQRMTEETPAVIAKADSLAADVKALKAMQAKHQVVYEKEKVKADAFLLAHEDMGASCVWMNVPQGWLPEGIARIDPRTGILESADMLAHCNRPFALDRESGEAEVDEDGMVYVQFGYESRTGTVADWSGVILTADDGDDPDAQGVPTLAGGPRGSPIKAKREQMNARIYNTFEGGSVNLNAVCSEAMAKCGQQLAIPRRVTAYSVEWAGLRNYALDGGISSVQYWSDGDLGKTVVGINTQFSRLNPITRTARGLNASEHDRREENERGMP